MLTPPDRARLDELHELGTSAVPVPACLCHNDLVVGNLFLDRRLRLIDFDYAVIGSPLIDLASLVMLNDLPSATVATLLSCYFGDEGPYSAAEFARVERLTRLVAHFWALASAGTAAGVDQYRMGND